MLPELAMLEHFHFLRPAWALLMLPMLAAMFVMDRREQQRDMFGGIIAPHLLEHLRISRFQSRWLNPRSFTRIIMVLLTVVLMGPSWRQQPSPLNQDDAALVILLDVSSSMQQRDVQPSRLQRAQQKIGDLLALRPDKRAALIVYAGSAHTVLSLTADRDIFNNYLAAIEPGIMPRPGKFPELALPVIAEILGDSTAPGTVVLFSDGAGSASQAAFETFFESHPQQLLVVGVGTEVDREGLVPLDRRALEGLASAAGGRFQALTVDDSDMRRLNRLIDNHYVIIEDSALPWLDSGYVLVFPAMALFLFWFRRGWTLVWSLLLLPLALALPPTPAQAAGATDQDGAGSHWFADLWLTPDQQGRLLLQLGRYREAAQRFEDLQWKGLALYYAEDFMAAAEYFSRSDSDRALFNEANARAHGRDYLRAVRRYDRLLARTPDFPGAAANRDKVQALIDEINRLSASQQQEQGVSSEEKQMGGEDAIPAEGAEELSWTEAELQQFSAEEILGDPATAEMWLRGVQQDPANFLAVKFSMQLQSAGEDRP